MMSDAMRQFIGAAGHIGVHFLVLDALNEQAPFGGNVGRNTDFTLGGAS